MVRNNYCFNERAVSFETVKSIVSAIKQENNALAKKFKLKVSERANLFSIEWNDKKIDEFTEPQYTADCREFVSIIDNAIFRAGVSESEYVEYMTILT